MIFFFFEILVSLAKQTSKILYKKRFEFESRKKYENLYPRKIGECAVAAQIFFNFFFLQKFENSSEKAAYVTDIVGP